MDSIICRDFYHKSRRSKISHENYVPYGFYVFYIFYLLSFWGETENMIVERHMSMRRYDDHYTLLGYPT